MKSFKKKNKKKKTKTKQNKTIKIKPLAKRDKIIIGGVSAIGPVTQIVAMDFIKLGSGMFGTIYKILHIKSNYTRISGNNIYFKPSNTKKLLSDIFTHTFVIKIYDDSRYNPDKVNRERVKYIIHNSIDPSLNILTLKGYNKEPATTTTIEPIIEPIKTKYPEIIFKIPDNFTISTIANNSNVATLINKKKYSVFEPILNMTMTQYINDLKRDQTGLISDDDLKKIESLMVKIAKIAIALYKPKLTASSELNLYTGHNDLKSDNIMLDDDKNEPYLIDLSFPEDGSPLFLYVSDKLFTPTGDNSLPDLARDAYAVGCVFYNILSMAHWRPFLKDKHHYFIQNMRLLLASNTLWNTITTESSIKNMKRGEELENIKKIETETFERYTIADDILKNLLDSNDQTRIDAINKLAAMADEKTKIQALITVKKVNTVRESWESVVGGEGSIGDIKGQFLCKCPLNDTINIKEALNLAKTNYDKHGFEIILKK